jgi:hypothetical protein
MNYSACITNVPHTAQGLAAIARLRQRGVHTRMRGRGHRFTGDARNPYHPHYQDLPIELSARFSVYQTEPGNTVSGYQRAEFIKLENDGRVRLRCKA